MMIEVTFKKVCTTHTTVYAVNSEWSLAELYQQLQQQIQTDFDIIPDRLELIDTLRSYPNEPDRIEADRALEKTTQKINERWSEDTLPFLSMYVRDRFVARRNR